MPTFYDSLIDKLTEAARLLLAPLLPAGVRVSDAHVAFFYRQSIEVIFRALATNEEANELIAAARVAVAQGARKQIAGAIMLMQEELLGGFLEQDGSEDVLRALALDQAVEATRTLLGSN